MSSGRMAPGARPGRPAGSRHVPAAPLPSALRSPLSPSPVGRTKGRHAHPERVCPGLPWRGRSILVAALLLLSFTVGATGCTRGSAGTGADSSARSGEEDAGAAAGRGRFVPPEGFTRLSISATPHLDPERLRQSIEPFAEHLSRELGVPVEVMVAGSYDELGAKMRAGQVDLGIFSPFAFVRAQRSDPGLQPVVNVITEGSESSASYIVVRSDSPLMSLEDLRGKRMAFVDPASASGFLYPMKLLLDRGLDPATFFSRAEFFGNHAAALLAVHEGRADAAATYQGAWSTLARWHSVDPLSFRVIAKAERTPTNLLCARTGLPEAVVEALRERLLALSVRTPEGRRVLRPMDVNGFVMPLTALYEQVRAADQQVYDGGRQWSFPFAADEGGGRDAGGR